MPHFLLFISSLHQALSFCRYQVGVFFERGKRDRLSFLILCSIQTVSQPVSKSGSIRLRLDSELEMLEKIEVVQITMTMPKGRKPSK